VIFEKDFTKKLANFTNDRFQLKTQITTIFSENYTKNYLKLT